MRTYESGYIVWYWPKGDTISSIQFRAAARVNYFFEKKSKKNREDLEEVLPFKKLKLEVLNDKNKPINYYLTLTYHYDKDIIREYCVDKKIEGVFNESLPNGKWVGRIRYKKYFFLNRYEEFEIILNKNKTKEIKI